MDSKGNDIIHFLARLPFQVVLAGAGSLNELCSGVLLSSACWCCAESALTGPLKSCESLK